MHAAGDGTSHDPDSGLRAAQTPDTRSLPFLSASGIEPPSAIESPSGVEPASMPIPASGDVAASVPIPASGVESPSGVESLSARASAAGDVAKRWQELSHEATALPERDEALDTLLGPGALVKSGRGEAGPGCTLVGGIGLPWLRDLDFGTNWLARAATLSWPDDVVLEDLSYAAHRAMHRLQELQPARVVLLGCMPRGEDPAGTIRRYALAELDEPDPDEVHERLGEAVGGIVDLDHTIAVCRHWQALPHDTVVIEVEPAESEFGWGFSQPVEDAVSKVLDMVRYEVSRSEGSTCKNPPRDVFFDRSSPSGGESS